MPQSLAVSNGVRAVVLPTVGCILVLASITVWMWSATQKEIRQAGQERFMFKVAESRDAVLQRLLANEQVLSGASAFIAASPDLARLSWRTYVARLDLNRTFPAFKPCPIRPPSREGKTAPPRLKKVGQTIGALQ